MFSQGFGWINLEENLTLETWKMTQPSVHLFSYWIHRYLNFTSFNGFLFPSRNITRVNVFHGTPGKVCSLLGRLYVASLYKTRLNWWFPCAASLQVSWSTDGCETRRGSEQTECLCHHLTYFSVLVVRSCKTAHRDAAAHRARLKTKIWYLLFCCRDLWQQLRPDSVCHLLALTAITSLGCAVSVISCVAILIYICRKR